MKRKITKKKVVKKKTTYGEEMNKKLNELFGDNEFICVGKTKDGNFVAGSASKVFVHIAAHVLADLDNSL